MKLYPDNLDFKDAHHLLVDSIVPRPIALISTANKNGLYNVAPYASLTIVAVKPTLVGF
jgi:flavin reductase (DIM6/NTAB) family NADH-FMN oxidoreductase RutF